ncbi:hypothetical protein HAX54_038830, partial [Datura stramonium]|nr:hypothetical protein [Datura stramonium]
EINIRTEERVEKSFKSNELQEKNVHMDKAKDREEAGNTTMMQEGEHKWGDSREDKEDY